MAAQFADRTKKSCALIWLAGSWLGCSGAEVQLTIQADEMLIVSGRAQTIATLTYRIDGDRSEPLTQSLEHQFSDGQERVIYHPALSDISMTFIIDGNDAAGADIAHGQSAAFVAADSATDVTVLLHDVRLTMPIDMASADLFQRDLSHEDLSHEDLSHEDLSHEDLSHEDLSHEELSEGPDMATPITPPRQLSPLSTVLVSTKKPTLRWSLPPDADGALVELCQPGFTSCALLTVDQTARTAKPTGNLSPGPWFWRLTGTKGSNVGPATSPIWEFFVPRVDGGFDSDWGPLPDFDRDGVVDVAIGASNANAGKGRVEVIPGPQYITTTKIGPPTGSPDLFGNRVAAAGDVNGDGYGDLLVSAPGQGLVSTSAVYFFSAARAVLRRALRPR